MILNAFNKAYHAAFSSVECPTSGILQVTWHGKIAVKDFFFNRVLNWIKESWQPYYESSLRILEIHWHHPRLRNVCCKYNFSTKNTQQFWVLCTFILFFKYCAISNMLATNSITCNNREVNSGSKLSCILQLTKNVSVHIINNFKLIFLCISVVFDCLLQWFIVW